MAIALYETDVEGIYVNFFDCSSCKYTGDDDPISIHTTEGIDHKFTKGVSKDYDRVLNAVKQALNLYR